MPARTGSRRQRLWICRFAWTTQTRCPHTHSRRKSSSRKLLDLKDKGRRDYTLTSAIPGPSSGVHFRQSESHTEEFRDIQLAERFIGYFLEKLRRHDALRASPQQRPSRRAS